MAAVSVSLLLRRTVGKHFVRRKTKLRLFQQQQQPCVVRPQLACPCNYYCTQKLFRSEVTVQYRDGLPVISVPLPSRRESCQFTLKPITNTVGDFLQYIQDEDGGIDRASVYAEDGSRVAKSTTIDNLMRHNFKLVINDQQYQVHPPPLQPMLSEDAQTLSDVKILISQLYSQLNVESYQLEREKELQQKLEDLKVQIQPLEQKRLELDQLANRRTKTLTWVGLGLMGVQFGLLARLTWWEYSWDIMEPVTYFVTYGTTIAMYAYYVLTKEEYNFPEVRDRQYLLSFYKNAKKTKLDVLKYNELRDAISKVEDDLRRLRDPLTLHLPIEKQKAIKL